jgi:hypothetical protein
VDLRRADAPGLALSPSAAVQRAAFLDR